MFAAGKSGGDSHSIQDENSPTAASTGVIRLSGGRAFFMLPLD